MQLSISKNANLSTREFQVLQLIAHEYCTKEIAGQLHVCYETAHSHRKNLLRKMGAKNAAGLIRRAFEIGLFSTKLKQQSA